MPAYRTEHPPSTSQLPTRFTAPKGRFADAGLPNTQISGPRTRFVRGRAGDFPMAVGLREVHYLQFFACPKDEYLPFFLSLIWGRFSFPQQVSLFRTQGWTLSFTLQTHPNIGLHPLFQRIWITHCLLTPCQQYIIIMVSTSRFIYKIHFLFRDSHTHISEHLIYTSSLLKSPR